MEGFWLKRSIINSVRLDIESSRTSRLDEIHFWIVLKTHIVKNTVTNISNVSLKIIICMIKRHSCGCWIMLNHGFGIFIFLCTIACLLYYVKKLSYIPLTLICIFFKKLVPKSAKPIGYVKIFTAFWCLLCQICFILDSKFVTHSNKYAQ